MRRRATFLLPCVALSLAVLASPLRASEVYRDDENDIRVSIDTTLSVGVSLRTEERARELIWIGHGGTNTNAASINADDGNLNYDQWDVYSTLLKATSELDARWGSYGFFTRVSGFFDPIANCTSSRGAGAPPPGGLPEDSPGFAAPGCSARTPLDSRARYRTTPFEGGVVGAQFRILDLYLEGDWDVAGAPLHLRFGNQVVSWGTSFFYQGINQINQVDVTKLRVPGAELKEALVPAPMVRLQAEPFANLSVDGFYQFWWFRTDLDPTGSYFSTNDLVGRGASLPAFGEGSTQGLFQPDVLGNVLGPADPGGTGLTPEELIFTAPPFARVRGVPRTGTDRPRSQGQGGVALRYFLDQLQTELGLYYLRYHSKTPVVGFEAYGIPSIPIFGIEAANAPWAYFTQYAPDVDLVGWSFATQIWSTAVSGEISYRWNDPVPLNALIGPALTPDFGPNQGGTTTRVDGFVREDRVQFVLNALASIAPGTRWIGRVVSWLGANEMTLLGEWGLVYYPNLDRACAATGDFGGGPTGSTIQTGCTPYAGPLATSLGVDDVSWGYQLRIAPSYYNPFGLPIRFQPFLSWLHDVEGITPGLNPYVDDRKAVDVGFDVIYLDAWTLRASYVNFLGAGAANPLHDRDALSFSLSYAF